MIDGIDPTVLARGYRQYRTATLVAIVVLFVIVTGPRIRHQPIALAGDYTEVLAALIWSILSITATAMIFRLLTANLHRPRRTVAQLVIFSELVALGVAICLPGLTIFTLALLERLHLAHTLEQRQIIYSHGIFVALLVVFPLALGPCFVAAQALLHRDINGGIWRRLQPLWTDLTIAYPQTVLNGPPRHLQPVTDLQVHRVIIEIHDALLRLAPHITELTPTDRRQLAHACRPGIDANQSAQHALQIAKAVAHPTRTNPSPASRAPRSAAATRDEELTQLLNLAAWWPTATQIAEEQDGVEDCP